MQRQCSYGRLGVSRAIGAQCNIQECNLKEVSSAAASIFGAPWVFEVDKADPQQKRPMVDLGAPESAWVSEFVLCLLRRNEIVLAMLLICE